ncbi:MAG: hypothetical protein IPL10_03665 [Bacteroidetes bacterium]|nr:hypothetical protein [Bacteroidota bacterium]
MGCKKRPELVGQPHSTWSIKKFANDYDQYFDKTTFSKDGKLLRLAPFQAFHFIWQEYNKDGSINGNLKNIVKSKQNLFKRGFANQSDANFIVILKY